MPNTELMQATLDHAHNELADINERARKLTDAINELIRAFAADHSCADKSVNYAIEYTADALVDLIDDATGPAYRRKVRIEVEIGAIEEKDLYRNSAVTI